MSKPGQPSVLIVANLLFLLLVTGVKASAEWTGIEVAGEVTQPGEKRKFFYLQSQSFEATYLNSPIFVARGQTKGYSLCITAGIHGDELNGMEIARRAFAAIDPQKLSGTVLVFPSVNADGARAGRRDMIDRRDLNRAFPGSPTGSAASIVANALFTLLKQHCHALIDLHTGSNKRFNLAQIRVTRGDERAINIARHFGVGIITLGDGPEGSLRHAMAEIRIPSILYEAGIAGEFQEPEIQQGVRGIISILRYLEMLPTGTIMELPESKIFERSRWTRVPAGSGGYFFPTCSLGGPVAEGDELGYIVDPLTDEKTIVRASHSGEIIGFATPQIVLSGYALVHIGVSPRAEE